MSYLSEAFHLVCLDAKQASPRPWYVCLVSSSQAYGGPEEGGWWYPINVLEAYEEHPSEETAQFVAKQVEEFATQLQAMAQQEHGAYCQRTMEWLDERGLDADFLPEPDGPTEYRVIVTQELPVYSNVRPAYC